MQDSCCAPCWAMCCRLAKFLSCSWCDGAGEQEVSCRPARQKRSSFHCNAEGDGTLKRSA